MMRKKLSFPTKACYGIGSLGHNSMGQTMGNFIMFFGTSVMGISGTLVGIAVAISSLWDGFSDPLIGHLSDNTRSRHFGRRHGFMLIGIFAIAFFNILIWSMPSSMNVTVKFFWLLFMLLGIETANTFYGTPFSALGIDIAPDYNEQSKIQGFKTVFSIIGMILPSVMMYFFMPSISIGIQTGFSQEGYLKIAYINSSLEIICGLIAIFGTIKYVRRTKELIHLPPKEKFNLSKLMNGYVDVLKKKEFRNVILGYSLATIASAFLMAVGMHLFTYCYHFNSGQISILLVALFGGAIISQPLWVKISNNFDKKKALIFGEILILFGLGFTSLTFLFRAYATAGVLFGMVFACILICGFGIGAMQSLPMSMYADVVTMEMHKTKKNSAGAYTGFYTFTYNLANSFALLMIGFFLDIIKFDSTQPVQAMSVQNGLGIIVFCGCAVALTLSIIIFSKYGIKRSDVLKTQLKINIAKKNEEK